MVRRTREFPLPEFSAAFLDRFSDLEEIGSGGMARVFRARQKTVNRAVAIKLIHPLAVRDENTLQRFLQEARITASLRHPNIIKIIDSGEEGDLPYLVFELVAGKTLEERLRREGPLPVTEALELAADLADALAYAHDRGVIHRDLKPENLLFTRAGTVKIADFGLAKLIDSSRRLTGVGFSVGTPGYMSPEQVLGAETDGRSDVYALGVMLYEMLTGVLPYPSHNDMNVMLDRMQQPYPPVRSRRPEVPEAVERLLARALTLDVNERCQSAHELREAVLDVVRPDRSGRVRTMRERLTTVKRAAAKMTRVGFPFALWGAGALALLVLGALAWSRLGSCRASVSPGHEPSGLAAMPGVRCARLYWTSTEPYAGRVKVWPGSASEEKARWLEEPAARTRHDLMLSGLDAGSTVHYRLRYPGGAESLRYTLRVPDARRLEARDVKVRAAPGGGLRVSWRTSVPARCWLGQAVGNQLQWVSAGPAYRRRHEAVLPDYRVYEGGGPLRLACLAAGGKTLLELPRASAAGSAADLEREASSLDVSSLVQRFDAHVRLAHRPATDLLPAALQAAAARFEGLAPAWFAEGPLARRLASYRVLTHLEHLDAVWMAGGLEPPLRAAAIYRPFVTTDYPDKAPAGTPIDLQRLSRVSFRALHGPRGLVGVPASVLAKGSVTSLATTVRLSKRDLDPAERALIVVKAQNLASEEHIRVRVNSTLDLFFRPATAGWPGTVEPSGEPATGPLRAATDLIAHGFPAAFLHSGENELEFSFDSVPGVASLNVAVLHGAWLVLEEAR